MATQEQIRTEITSQIIEALEKGGIPPWRQPWLGMTTRDVPPTSSAANRIVESTRCFWPFISIGMVSGLAGTARSSSGRTWAAGSCGDRTTCRLANGAAGSSICPNDQDRENDHGERGREGHPLPQTILGLLRRPSGRRSSGPPAGKDDGPLNTEFVDFEPAERAIAATEADIRYIGDRAFYHRDADHIQVPPKDQVPAGERVLFDLLSRIGHWSEKRTEWKGDYAEGELRAEIAAAYMLAELGVPQSSDLSNHQAYVGTGSKLCGTTTGSSSVPARRRTRRRITF